MDTARSGVFPRTPTLIAMTALSGFLSAIKLLPDVGVDGTEATYEWMRAFPMMYGPGLYFGIAIASFLRYFEKVSLGKAAAWGIASVISWRIAIEMALTGFGVQLTDSETLASIVQGFILPGAIGGALLGLAHYLIVMNGDAKWVGRIALAGGAGGLAMYLCTIPESSGETGRLVVMFGIWQIGVALTLDAWTRQGRDAAHSQVTSATPG